MIEKAYLYMAEKCETELRFYRDSIAPLLILTYDFTKVTILW